MDKKLVFGLSTDEIAFLSAVGQIIIALAALFLTIINLKILRRLNIVDSMRRVNDKFSELNSLELDNEHLIKLNPLNYDDNEKISKEKIQEIKKNNLTFNYINILESVFIEMKYKTLKRSHAMKILDSFIPALIKNETIKKLLLNSGYDNEFVAFCLTYETKQHD